jgi:purine catabolism regulator
VLVLVPPGSDESALERAGWACGIGGEKALAKASQSLEEARAAVLVSARLREGGPVRYDGLGADRLLVLLLKRQKEELQAFVQETLGPLLEHDARYATHLLPTVESFALHAGRLRETAGEIYVHRNTLAYRLERASEVLGKDLKDPETLLTIALALKGLRLLDEPGETKDNRRKTRQVG